tara:strand:- start:166 stop:444 length:279 start_codon:yes stop_codon:yes gene_type:complete
MPSYYDTHYEDEQDWETVVIKNTKNEIKTPIVCNKELPLHRKIFLGRQRSKYTANQLASILRISLNEYEDFENNRTTPSKACLSKLRKYIDI